MRLRAFFSVRSGSAAIAVAAAIAILAPAQMAIVAARADSIRQREPRAAAPSINPAPAASVRSYASHPSPVPVVRTASPKPTAASRPVQGGRLAVFGGLGAWVDVYDFEALSPAAAVAEMGRYGVRTLYIQTGRFNDVAAVAPEVAPWLGAAHRAGLRVVGWYLPGYGDLRFDVARTIAIARYRAAGQRFDGIGIDIEDKTVVPSARQWNQRVWKHSAMVRRALGPDYPIAAITPPPLQMSLAPMHWRDFPWRALSRSADVFMLMSYWSYRDECPRIAAQCAYGYTRDNVLLTRALTHRPVHVIGGVGDSITPAEVRDFALGARASGAFGASLYDFRTTAPSFWKALSSLRLL